MSLHNTMFLLCSSHYSLFCSFRSLFFFALHLPPPLLFLLPLFSAQGGGSSVAVTGIAVGIVVGVVVLLGTIVVCTILTFIWIKCKQGARGGSNDAEMWFRER